MEINHINHNIQMHTDFSGEVFSIGDMSLIMEILRSKMYSNPIKTIAREITANARDANREAGKENTPIKIYFADIIDRSFAVEDEGPGISPERMTNIFLQYGKSTKRADNTQTGGFGLGAKSPFAYTDNFIIETTTKEGDKFIKRDYIAYIDETRVGKISKTAEKETQGPTGTKIKLAIKHGDNESFKKYVSEAAQYWKVKPITYPSDSQIKWKETKIKYQSDPIDPIWVIHERPKNYYDHAPWITIVVDGFPFVYGEYHGEYKNFFDILSVSNASKMTCDHEKISEKWKNTFKSLSPCVLYFNTGELDIIASRENIDFTKKSVDAIFTRMEEALENISVIAEKSVQSKIDKALNWNHACKIYDSEIINLKEAGCDKDLLWNNQPLITCIQDNNSLLKSALTPTTKVAPVNTNTKNNTSSVANTLPQEEPKLMISEYHCGDYSDIWKRKDSTRFEYKDDKLSMFFCYIYIEDDTEDKRHLHLNKKIDNLYKEYTEKISTNYNIKDYKKYQFKVFLIKIDPTFKKDTEKYFHWSKLFDVKLSDLPAPVITSSPNKKAKAEQIRSGYISCTYDKYFAQNNFSITYNPRMILSDYIEKTSAVWALENNGKYYADLEMKQLVTAGDLKCVMAFANYTNKTNSKSNISASNMHTSVRTITKSAYKKHKPKITMFADYIKKFNDFLIKNTDLAHIIFSDPTIKLDCITLYQRSYPNNYLNTNILNMEVGEIKSLEDYSSNINHRLQVMDPKTSKKFENHPIGKLKALIHKIKMSMQTVEYFNLVEDIKNGLKYDSMPVLPKIDVKQTDWIKEIEIVQQELITKCPITAAILGIDRKSFISLLEKELDFPIQII